MANLEALRSSMADEYRKLQSLQKELATASERLARGKTQLQNYPVANMKDKRYAAIVSAIKAEQSKVSSLTVSVKAQNTKYNSVKKIVDDNIAAANRPDNTSNIAALQRQREDALNIGDKATANKLQTEIGNLQNQNRPDKAVTGSAGDRLAPDASPDANAAWRKNQVWSGVMQAINSTDTKTQIKASDGGTGLIRNDEEIFLLPDASGKFVLSGQDASVVTANSFRNKIYSMSSAEIKGLQKALGLKQTGFYQDVAESAVKAARTVSLENFRNALRVGDSATGKIPEMPYSIESFGSISGSSGGGGVSRTVSTSSFDAADAEILLNEYYQKTLGRNATAAEIGSFKDTINKRAKARPQVTTTSTSGGTSNVSTTPGFTESDAQLLARKQAYAAPGATGFLAATQYMDVINNMIRNPLG